MKAESFTMRRRAENWRDILHVDYNIYSDVIPEWGAGGLSGGWIRATVLSGHVVIFVDRP